MATYLGDFVEDETVHFLWTTNDGDGASITRATDGTISVYKDNNATQSTAGITDTEDFDSLTGIHACTIDLSADAFYATGANYSVVLSAATIDGQTVNSVIAHFSIENRFAEVDVVKWLGTAAATPTTAGVPEVDVTHWNATALATTNPLPDAAPDADAGLVTHDKHLAYVQLQCRSDAEITADRSTELTAINADEGTGGGDFAAQGESLEALRDRGDAAWTTGSGTGLTPISTGTAQSATSTTLVLAAGETFANDELNGSILFITGGSTGVGQTRRITNYVGATDTATVATWTTTPTGTITYEIWPGVAGESPTAAEVADAVCDEALSGHTTAGTLAKAIADIETDATAILADTNELQTDDVPGLISALNDPTAAAVADAVLDEALAGHTGAGSLGKAVADIETDATAILADTNELQSDDVPGLIAALNDPTAASIADAVWDEAATGHTDAGKAGAQLWTDIDAILADTNELQTDDVPGLIAALNDPTAAAIANAVWDEATSDHVGAGSAGKELGDLYDGLVGTLSEITGAADIPAAPTIKQALMLLYMYVRNAGQATSAERRVMNDAGTEVLDAAMSDDGTTFDQGELGAP